MRSILFLTIVGFLLIFPACKSQKADTHTYTNRLIDQSSPYLLQHAHNPVNWYPWGEEALEKAKKENKMMLISIGYSACHWCHVMEHESFEDTTVARIMNENFVAIKIDREERPDIDDVYMTACHMATGKSCGWPLNAFALPDGRPVWAGTYFPKKQWMEVLEYFIQLKENDLPKLDTYATELTKGIANNDVMPAIRSDDSFSEDVIHAIGKQFFRNIDFKKGGTLGSPKFPMPSNYDFLLHYYQYSKEEKALGAIKITLDQMAMGGIYDHLGGGFARYSTDDVWKVPHFEKMLYDNGQLISLYSKAFQLTKDPLYEEVVRQSLGFIERELTSPEGGFYSSLDADSEGEEGKFYVWSAAEIDEVLNDKTAAQLFKDYYEVSAKGNWEGHNILYRRKSVEDLIKKYQLTEEVLHQSIAKSKKLLFQTRSKRIRPGLDDKVLTSWNALMLQGYIDAYKAFGEEKYRDAALKNANFLEQNMLQSDFRLNRNYKDGKSVINAFLDDYALLIQAFTSLYEITFEEKWLFKAKGLADYTIQHFFDASSGLFHYTSNLDPPLVARKKELADNVIPASNSILGRALFSLGTYLDSEDYKEKAAQMLQNMLPSMIENKQPNFYSNWCALYLDQLTPPYEIAIMGDNYEVLRKSLSQRFLPNVRFLGGKQEGQLALLKDKLVADETLIYVCQNKVCKFPVRTVEKAMELLN